MREREGVRWCIHKLLLVWSFLRGLIFHTPSYGYIHLRPPSLIGVDVQHVCGQGSLCAGHLDIDWCRLCAEECRVQYKNRLRRSHKFSDQRKEIGEKEKFKLQLRIEAPNYGRLWRNSMTSHERFIDTSLKKCIHYWNSVICSWSHCVFYRMSLEVFFLCSLGSGRRGFHCSCVPQEM